MFPRLYDPAFRPTQLYYCRVEFFDQCERLRCERAGAPAPPDLLPDGRSLGPAASQPTPWSSSGS